MSISSIKKAYKAFPFAFSKRTEASLAIIDGIDDVLACFLKRQSNDVADLMLDVYGLLQSLFVGIDALYGLVIGTTQYKYHININQNPTLRELKYIRNDIVGHPTHRTYDDGSYGFSVIREDVMTRKSLIYDTYIITKNHSETKSQEIEFKVLIDQFLKEKKLVLDELEVYINNRPVDSGVVSLTYSLLNKALEFQYDLSDIEPIRKVFIKDQKIKRDSNNRFLWRLDLLELLYQWKNNEFSDFINYLRVMISYKLYEIACDMYKQKKEYFKVSLPKVLVQFYRFMKKHDDSVELLSNLADLNHPLFNNDVKQLLSLNPPKQVKKLLVWLTSFTDSRYVYLIGTSLKAYRKK